MEEQEALAIELLTYLLYRAIKINIDIVQSFIKILLIVISVPSYIVQSELKLKSIKV